MGNINANLPLDKAELIAFFLEGFLYGVSALLFVVTIWVLIYRRKSERLNKRLVAISSFMMFFSTVHLAVDLGRILEGFINRRDQPGGSIAYFAKLFDWSFVFKTSIFVIQTVLADSFATYRCYVVWHSIWAGAVPSIFVIATLTTGTGVVYNCAILQAGEDVFSSSLTGWITAFFVLTLTTNIFCTSLISTRIFSITTEVAQFSDQLSLIPVVVVIIESGAIYSISCIITLVVYLLGSNAQYPAIDGMFPIISIAFNLIIVRIALGISHGGASLATTKNPPSAVVDASRTHSPRHSQYSMKPLAITVTQLVQNDSGDIESGKTLSHIKGHGDVEIHR